MYMKSSLWGTGFIRPPASLEQAGRNESNVVIPAKARLQDVGGRAASGTGRRGIQWFLLYISA